MAIIAVAPAAIKVDFKFIVIPPLAALLDRLSHLGAIDAPRKMVYHPEMKRSEWKLDTQDFLVYQISNFYRNALNDQSSKTFRGSV
ncbi:hypothetical protein [Marivita sp.]|uniref:hypothetical protein n=1 Tax=Marivita sp. TaxID=2003365 RepID=UPI003F6D9821